ncbi:MAG: DUF4062 domain-containing protein [Ruminococcaceae bacterium]|nr:DUF4062 domain-containing protein [Oscillospiraceae bacterium]
MIDQILSNYFVVDANDMPLDESLLKVLYRTDPIKTFLSNNDFTKSSIFAVSSPKGYGKTFVLKAKKVLMQQNRGTLLIPENQELDSIASIRYNSTTTNFLSDYKNWVDLWQVSITLSAIKNAILKNQGINDYVEELNDDCKMYLNNKLYTTPCQYFNFLYQLSIKDLNKLFKELPKLIIVYQQIHFQMCMFIDNIDESMVVCLENDPSMQVTHGKYKRIFWTYAQTSLIEAISKLHKFSQHIKIFCSIRHEATIGKENELNQQMENHIVRIEYTYNDLKNIYNNYISLIGYNENNLVNPLENISYVEHIQTCEKEPVFDYIYRHTLKNPRDIMEMLKSIYLRSEVIEISEFRKIVNEKSAEICKKYLERTEKFINELSLEQLDTLFSLIYSNVLSYRDINEICRKFNYLNGNNCNNDCQTSCDTDNFHPFCTLYKMGLLGYIFQQNFETEKKQTFLPCGTGIVLDKLHIPRSNFYFIHPSLDSYIQEIRNRKKLEFSIHSNFIVGDNIIYRSNIDKKSILTDRKILISSVCRGDMETKRAQLKKYLIEKGFKNVYINEEDNSAFDETGLNNHDKCLRTIEQMDIVILIVNEEYGGRYSGSLYQDKAAEYANKFIKDDNLEKELSITWCEFIRALETGKTIFTFILRKLWDERHIYIENKKRGIEIYRPFVRDLRTYYFAEFVDKNTWVHNFYYKFDDITKALEEYFDW